MRKKSTKQREADIEAIRESIASITKTELTEILKSQRGAISNAPLDLGPVPEQTDGSAAYSPVDDHGHLLPMPRQDPTRVRRLLIGRLSGRMPRKRSK